MFWWPHTVISITAFGLKNVVPSDNDRHSDLFYLWGEEVYFLQCWKSFWSNILLDFQLFQILTVHFQLRQYLFFGMPSLLWGWLFLLVLFLVFPWTCCVQSSVKLVNLFNGVSLCRISSITFCYFSLFNIIVKDIMKRGFSLLYANAYEGLSYP